MKEIRQRIPIFVVVVGLFILGIVLLPLFAALFCRLTLCQTVRPSSLQIALVEDLCPHFLVGISLGILASLLSRTRKILISIVSIALVCVVYSFWIATGPARPKLGMTRQDVFLFVSWTFGITGAWLAAHVGTEISRRRTAMGRSEQSG